MGNDVQLVKVNFRDVCVWPQVNILFILACLRDVAMALVMSLIVVMVWWLTATIILSHSVDPQGGMHAAGVEGKHNLSWIRLLSMCWRRVSPRVGWSPLVAIHISRDVPKRFDDRLKGTGLEAVDWTMGSM